MAEPVLNLRRRGNVGIARVNLTEILRPDELDAVGKEFRAAVAESNLAAYVLDLSALRHLTSAALGMLISVHAHLKAEGKRFAVVAPDELVRETLEHAHLEKLFPILLDVNKAVETLAD